jgi:hypothetical protein
MINKILVNITASNRLPTKKELTPTKKEYNGNQLSD